jgi:hypothetical protein
LATLKQQTDALLNSFASFIIAATGLPVYLYGKEFTRPAGQYITLNVLSILENGTADAMMSDEDGFMSSRLNYNVRITAVCYRENAYIPLMTLKQRIQSYSNMYDTYFTSNSFGYLTSTQVLRYDAPVDNVTFEERASSTFDFNLSILDEEPATSTIIDTVNINQTVYDPNKQSEDYAISIVDTIINTPQRTVDSSNELFGLINEDMVDGGTSDWIP